METQYYYIRLAAYDDKAGKEGIATWHPCTKARAEKRAKAAIDTESFYNHVVTVKVSEFTIQIMDFLWDIREGTGCAIVTVNRYYVQSEPLENTIRFALGAYEKTADTIISIATAQ